MQAVRNDEHGALFVRFRLNFCQFLLNHLGLNLAGKTQSCFVCFFPVPSNALAFCKP
ncbi:MAG: hypothetical protein HKUEN07_07840 [Rhodocyclaceae bacterium]|nr:MAG: hypothetical protein HKUEN07_07840 [Rhodocyclaceae bacterium]